VARLWPFRGPDGFPGQTADYCFLRQFIAVTRSILSFSSLNDQPMNSFMVGFLWTLGLACAEGATVDPAASWQSAFILVIKLLTWPAPLREKLVVCGMEGLATEQS
jgi:hypothetical protein